MRATRISIGIGMTLLAAAMAPATARAQSGGFPIANTPLRVELRSDGETEVSVHHVGRLGTLRSRAIEVLPGIYTVVGRRKGYRDVRLTLEVKPGEPGPPLEVVCTERIDG